MSGVLALAAFIVLGIAVSRGLTTQFDLGVAGLFRTSANDLLGPRWFQEAARDVTGLGSLTVLGLGLVCAVANLAASGCRRCAAVLLGGVLSGDAICFLLKIPFGRPRPDLTVGAPQVFTASFPSAHAMTSVILFGLLALMARHATDRQALRRCLTASAIIVLILIGLSRLYLGVHWATDILAGWLGGIAWIVAVWRWGARSCLGELRHRMTPPPKEGRGAA